VGWVKGVDAEGVWVGEFEVEISKMGCWISA